MCTKHANSGLFNDGILETRICKLKQSNVSPRARPSRTFTDHARNLNWRLSLAKQSWRASFSYEKSDELTSKSKGNVHIYYIILIYNFLPAPQPAEYHNINKVSYIFCMQSFMFSLRVK